MKFHIDDELLHGVILVFVIAGIVLSLQNAHGAEGGVRPTPCQALRNNLWNAGVPPAQIMDEVAYCISNFEQRRIRVLTDPEEIKEFRSRTYIAPPRLVEKNQRGESNE